MTLRTPSTVLLSRARQEVAYVQAWVCATCPTMLEEGQIRYCRSCAMYWQDDEKGLFDDPEPTFTCLGLNP